MTLGRLAVDLELLLFSIQLLENHQAGCSSSTYRCCPHHWSVKAEKMSATYTTWDTQRNYLVTSIQYLLDCVRRRTKLRFMVPAILTSIQQELFDSTEFKVLGHSRKDSSENQAKNLDITNVFTIGNILRYDLLSTK